MGSTQTVSPSITRRSTSERGARADAQLLAERRWQSGLSFRRDRDPRALCVSGGLTGQPETA